MSKLISPNLISFNNKVDVANFLPTFSLLNPANCFLSLLIPYLDGLLATIEDDCISVLNGIVSKFFSFLGVNLKSDKVRVL